MKHSPHNDQHKKSKAIRDTNRTLESCCESPMPEKKWPYHVENDETEKAQKHPKKQAKKSSPSEVNERTEPAVVQHESPRWNKVIQSKVLEEESRNNKKINTQKSDKNHH